MPSMLDLAAAHFGRRRIIRRSEMREFLAHLNVAGVLELASQWPIEAPDGDLAAAWAAACSGIKLISLIDRDNDPGAPASINRGSIRYDDPGNTYAGFKVTLMFAPAAMADRPYDQLGQLRHYARRLLIVRD